MTAQLVVIDGSEGEGGGQIVRSSLALALVTGQPIRVENVRAGRDKPGLLRQHLAAVRAATEIGAAEVRGAEIGSTSLEFRPTTIRGGNYSCTVGTAGSATLVLQTILPALLIAKTPSELVLEGGTHNPGAPPFDFLRHAFLPLVNRMGPKVELGFERHGFYPAGGGRFTARIEPIAALTGFDLLERGEIMHRSVTALVAHLARGIGQREIDVAAEKLNWPSSEFHVDASIDSAGPGNVVMIEVHAANVREVFIGFGRIGASAEKVAHEAVKEARAYLASDVPVGHYLADQLMLPLGIAAWQTGCTSRFRTLPLSRHSTTQVSLLQRFLDISIDVERDETGCHVTLGR